MSEIRARAGGFVALDSGGWVPADSEAARAAEASEPESDPLDEYATGGGWYEIDGEKYHGKEKARAALEE